MPLIELYFALTAYLFYMYPLINLTIFSFYLRKRLINDFTGELDKSFRTDFNVFYVMVTIGLTLIYFFFLMMSLKFGTM